jgi:selenocysteine lyase/cysteine desulfurase
MTGLHRPWFSGGTVEWVTHVPARHRLRDGPDRFEDGTPAFLAAGAVAPALTAVRDAGASRLARHLRALTGRCLDGLGALRHPNGAPAVVRYGPGTSVRRGATLAFNLLDDAGRVLSHDAVETRAAELGLAVRGGCFCNPGASAAAFGWDGPTVERELGALGSDFAPERLATRMPGRAVGAIRISMGLGSVRADVERAIDVLEQVAIEGVARPAP